MVDAFLLTAALPQAEGQIFNLGAPDHVSLLDTARLLAKVSPGAKFELVPFPPDRKAIDIGDYYADFSKIRRELGWIPQVPLAEGLRRSLDYFRRHLLHYR